MTPEFGVVVINNGRCVFASCKMTKAEAEALALKLEGAVINVVNGEELLCWKRMMTSPKGLR